MAGLLVTCITKPDLLTPDKPHAGKLDGASVRYDSENCCARLYLRYFSPLRVRRQQDIVGRFSIQ